MDYIRNTDETRGPFRPVLDAITVLWPRDTIIYPVDAAQALFDQLMGEDGLWINTWMALRQIETAISATEIAIFMNVYQEQLKAQQNQLQKWKWRVLTHGDALKKTSKTYIEMPNFKNDLLGLVLACNNAYVWMSLIKRDWFVSSELYWINTRQKLLNAVEVLSDILKTIKNIPSELVEKFRQTGTLVTWATYVSVGVGAFWLLRNTGKKKKNA